MKALVTGAAGFIGSTLSEKLLSEGHQVKGVDCYTDYYDVNAKRQNLKIANSHKSFEHIEADLSTCDLDRLLDEVDVVFHQAGQPGVRLSWSNGFGEYVRLNINVTQRLLEASRNKNLKRFVYASSSSVYGNAERYPTEETDAPQPYSPYGVTKLAAEHLCSLYASNWGLPTVSLRYFTVYGPRQRPDMAFTRMMKTAVNGEPFTLNGTGEQIRDFTFVDDVVNANIAASTEDIEPGSVFNVAGGGSVSMNQVIETIENITGEPLNIVRGPATAGDVFQTGGSINLAMKELGWKPTVSLEEGLRAHYEWAKTAFSPESDN